MHYYPFNIGDYAASTQHLEPMEDLAYRRMLDLYYSKESALPESVEEIARLVRMRSHKECIAVVLQDFFTFKDGFWHCEKADDEIGKYQLKSEKARKSAESRWKNKQKTCERIANAEQSKSESNADGMLTNNQEPITNKQEPIDWSAMQMSESEISEIKKIRKNAKSPITQRVVDQLAKQFELSRKRGYSNDDILNEWSIKGWRAYKDEWMKIPVPRRQQPQQQEYNHEAARQREIEEIRKQFQ